MQNQQQRQQQQLMQQQLAATGGASNMQINPMLMNTTNPMMMAMTHQNQMYMMQQQRQPMMYNQYNPMMASQKGAMMTPMGMYPKSQLASYNTGIVQPQSKFRPLNEAFSEPHDKKKSSQELPPANYGPSISATAPGAAGQQYNTQFSGMSFPQSTIGNTLGKTAGGNLNMTISIPQSGTMTPAYQNNNIVTQTQTAQYSRAKPAHTSSPMASIVTSTMNQTTMTQPPKICIPSATPAQQSQITVPTPTPAQITVPTPTPAQVTVPTQQPQITVPGAFTSSQNVTSPQMPELNPKRAIFGNRHEMEGCFSSLGSVTEMFQGKNSVPLCDALLTAGISNPACSTIASICEVRANEIYGKIHECKRYEGLSVEDIATLICLNWHESGFANVPLQEDKYPINILNVALSGIRRVDALASVTCLLSKVFTAIRHIARFCESPPIPMYTYSTWSPLPYARCGHYKWLGFMPLTTSEEVAVKAAGPSGTVIPIKGFYSAYDLTPFTVTGDVDALINCAQTGAPRRVLLEPETGFVVDEIIMKSPNMEMRVTVDSPHNFVLDGLYTPTLVRIDTKPNASLNVDTRNKEDDGIENDRIEGLKPKAPPKDLVELLSKAPSCEQRLGQDDLPTIDHFTGYNPTSTSVILRWSCFRREVSFRLTMKKKTFGKGKIETVYYGSDLCYLCENLDPDSSYEFRLFPKYGDRYMPYLSTEVRTLSKSADYMGKSAWRTCPMNGSWGEEYRVTGSPFSRNVIKVNGNKPCAVIGSVALPSNSVSAWGIHVAVSKKNDCSAVYVGVAPSDIDLFDSKNYLKNGWFLNCFNFTLCSGPPQNVSFDRYMDTDKKGVMKVGDTIVAEMNMKTGTLSFIVGGVQKVAFEGIPKNKKLVPIVMFFLEGDSFDLIV